MDKNASQIAEQIKQIFATYGIDVVGAIVILVVGWMAADWIRGIVYKALGRVPNMDGTLQPFLANLARWIILAFVIIAVLNQFGVETTSVIAMLGAAGLAVGLALQGTLSNVASGVMLLVLRPFKIGDVITAGGLTAAVAEIGLFTTEFKTGDGIFVMVPNSQLWGTSITNYSRNPTRRIDIVVGIAYADSVDGAMKVLDGLMNADARVLKDPAPQSMVVDLADSSVNINMRCWVNNADYWAALADLKKGAKGAIEGAGYSIPFPQRDIHMIGGK